MTAHARGLSLAALGILVLSFDGLLVRLAASDGWSVLFWRGALTALCMGLLYGRRERLRSLRGHGAVVLASAVLQALVSLFFVLAVTHTAVANVVVILTTAPLFAACFTRCFLREAVAARTWLAILFSGLGLLLVFGGSLRGEGLLGNLYALASAAAVGANLTLLRRYPDIDRMPLIAFGGVCAALIAWPWATPFGLAADSYRALALMGLLQMPLATALLSNATRYLPSAEVALFFLLEALLGSLWVWWLLGERPPAATVYGGGLVLLTLLLNAWLGLRASRTPRLPGLVR